MHLQGNLQSDVFGLLSQDHPHLDDHMHAQLSVFSALAHTHIGVQFPSSPALKDTNVTSQKRYRRLYEESKRVRK